MSLMQPTYHVEVWRSGSLFSWRSGQRFAGTPAGWSVVEHGRWPRPACAGCCKPIYPRSGLCSADLLAVVRMSWFSYFGNGYWGGSVAMLGGCLLLGAAARLARGPNDGALRAPDGDGAYFCWQTHVRLKVLCFRCRFVLIRWLESCLKNERVLRLLASRASRFCWRERS